MIWGLDIHGEFLDIVILTKKESHREERAREIAVDTLSRAGKGIVKTNDMKIS